MSSESLAYENSTDSWKICSISYQATTDASRLRSLRWAFPEIMIKFRDIGRAYGFVELDTAYRVILAHSIGIMPGSQGIVNVLSQNLTVSPQVSSPRTPTSTHEHRSFDIHFNR